MCMNLDEAVSLRKYRTAYAQLLHSVDQRRPFHSQALRSTISATYYPIARIKRTEDVISFDLLKTSYGQVCPLVSTE